MSHHEKYIAADMTISAIKNTVQFMDINTMPSENTYRTIIESLKNMINIYDENIKRLDAIDAKYEQERNK